MRSPPCSAQDYRQATVYHPSWNNRLYPELWSHDRASRAIGILLTLLKMPYACCYVLEDGGVRWWGICSKRYAEQVGEGVGSPRCCLGCPVFPWWEFPRLRDSSSIRVRQNGSKRRGVNQGNTEAVSGPPGTKTTCSFLSIQQRKKKFRMEARQP